MVTDRSGMREVIAAQSALTWIDGATGQLRYRGYPISELAERCSFEQVAHLLWHGELPSDAELATLQAELRSVRGERLDLLVKLAEVPLSAHPLEVLRYLVSWDALVDRRGRENTDGANFQTAKAFTAWFPLAVAGYHRRRQGQQPVRPRPNLDTAANFLYMLHDREPTDLAVRTLDTSLVLHADHEFNASTFAARVTIATQSNLHSAVASALGTLAGPRHGGASEGVIEMLEDIQSPQRAEAWAKEKLGRSERIMGFGHAVYRTADPRSRHLRAMAEKLLAGTPREPWIEILTNLGRVMERERELFPNVDLYAAVVNHELGIDPAFYTSVFACSRVSGWTAHAMEQLGSRMIRPAAEYVGPGPRSLLAPAPHA